MSPPAAQAESGLGPLVSVNADDRSITDEGRPAFTLTSAMPEAVTASMAT